MTDAIVEVRDAYKHFPVTQSFFNAVKRISKEVIHAVDGVSIDIREKETLGLIGESGSGKTTLGWLVARLHNLTRGTIRLDGKDITSIFFPEVGRRLSKGAVFGPSAERSRSSSKTPSAPWTPDSASGRSLESRPAPKDRSAARSFDRVLPSCSQQSGFPADRWINIPTNSPEEGVSVSRSPEPSSYIPSSSFSTSRPAPWMSPSKPRFSTGL